MKLGFDLDGTIISCKEKHIFCLKYALSVLGCDKKIDFESYWSEKLAGKNNYHALINQKLDARLIEQICREWVKHIESNEALRHDLIYPNALDVLEKLSNKHSLYLISARKNKNNAEAQFNEMGLERFFQDWAFVEHDNVVANKANAMEIFEVQNYIGDAETDFLACDLVKVDFIATSFGMRQRGFWEDRINIVDSWGQIEEVFL